MTLLEHEPATHRPPYRTPTPRRLPDAPDGGGPNAVVVEPFGLWHGEAGHREVAAGARCRISDVLPCGLARFHDERTWPAGALVAAEHFRLDDVRDEGYRP